MMCIFVSLVMEMKNKRSFPFLSPEQSSHCFVVTLFEQTTSSACFPSPFFHAWSGYRRNVINRIRHLSSRRSEVQIPRPKTNLVVGIILLSTCSLAPYVPRCQLKFQGHGCLSPYTHPHPRALGPRGWKMLPPPKKKHSCFKHVLRVAIICDR